MNKKSNLIKICTFLLAFAPIMVESRLSFLLLGEPKLPAKYNQ